MAGGAVTPRYPTGVSRANSQMRRIRDIADSVPHYPIAGAARLFAVIAANGSGGFEIVGRDAVQELFELLDLVFADGAGRLVVVLVGNQQSGFGQHRFFDVDRHAHAQRDRHRIRWPRRDGDVAVENQVGVERALLQVDDPHLFERMTKRGNQIPYQVVGQRAGRLDSLLFQGNRGRFGLADPNRQVTSTVGLAQQQDRLVLRLLDANADNANFTHLCLPSARAAGPNQPCPDVTVEHQAAVHKLWFRSLVLQRCRTSRTADLINEVCSVMARAATSRARSSARSREPVLPALTRGPAICAIRSDCRSAAERNARRWRGSTP